MGNWVYSVLLCSKRHELSNLRKINSSSGRLFTYSEQSVRPHQHPSSPARISVGLLPPLPLHADVHGALLATVASTVFSSSPKLPILSAHTVLYEAGLERTEKNLGPDSGEVVMSCFRVRGAPRSTFLLCEVGRMGKQERVCRVPVV